MDLKAAVTVARQRVADLFAPEIPENVRLESFLYDDHLGVWSLTIGFALSKQSQGRNYKVIRVSEANKSVLSVSDR